MKSNVRRGGRAAICAAVAGVLLTAGLSTAGGAAVRAADEGVTAKAIKLGFIYPATGVAASISQNGLKAFQARVDRTNAKGGVNGRKIEVVSRDDASSGANLTAAQDLVENEHVFAVVNESPFAFLSYRFLLEHQVPMIGNGVDGTYYQQKGNEDILSTAGNSNPFGDLTYDSPARIMKMLGVKKVGVLAYGAASSSVATAKALMNYAVPEVGLDPTYTNTSIDFGSADVATPVLGIKNAGVDGVYLPMAAATNIAVAQGLQQSGVDVKATISGTGYGQDLLDSPAAKSLPPTTYFSVGGKPVEIKDAATKQFQADLKKYAKFTGVPDYGMYTGYILADYAIAGLLKAGKTPTRQGLIDGAHSIGMYDQAGLACQPVDVSLAGRGKVPATNCAYVVQLKDGKFVPFPKNGKPIQAKLVGSPEALAANKSAAAAAPATTAAPAWLTAALSPRFPGVQVEAVTRGPVVERLSTNARFRIECTLPTPPELPLALCVKGYFSEAGRSIGAVGEPEACFYRDLADATGVHTLRSVWADVDPETRHGVAITEDVIDAGGRFLDALSPYSVEQVASSLGELAHLHSYAWERPELLGADWLIPRVGRTLEVRGEPEINRNFDGPNGVGVPPEVRDAPRLIDAMRALAAREPGPGWTLIHGDAHVGNLFLDAEGRPGLLDWQLVQHGHWSIDVGYHIASALEPSERASTERELLAHYLDELRGRGVNAPAFDDAWIAYRGGIAYGFFLWAITMYVQPDIIAALLRRLGTAAHELESYAVLS